MSESQDERLQKFKELIKQGYGVNKALAEAGLGKGWYDRHYDEIWSDPEMAPYKPKTYRKSAANTVENAIKRLEKYGVKEEELTDLEKELMEAEEKRKKALRAAQRIIITYGGPSVGIPQEVEKGDEEGPKDPLTEFERSLREFEERRKKIKEMLERMGFKVEDMYMHRDEVQRLVEEVRRRAEEDMLDDRRIQAAENIIRDAVAQVIALFKPAIDALFLAPQSTQPPT